MTDLRRRILEFIEYRGDINAEQALVIHGKTSLKGAQETLRLMHDAKFIRISGFKKRHAGLPAPIYVKWDGLPDAPKPLAVLEEERAKTEPSIAYKLFVIDTVTRKTQGA